MPLSSYTALLSPYRFIINKKRGVLLLQDAPRFDYCFYFVVTGFYIDFCIRAISLPLNCRLFFKIDHQHRYIRRVYAVNSARLP